MKAKEQLEQIRLNKDFERKIHEIQKSERLQNHLNDEDYRVRLAIAEQGYYLAKLQHDKHLLVRMAVYRASANPENFVNSKDWQIREDIAHRGLFLEYLFNDKNDKVRLAVAEEGYNLEFIAKENDEINFPESINFAKKALHLINQKKKRNEI